MFDRPLQCDSHRGRIVLSSRLLPENLAVLAQFSAHRPVARVHRLFGGAPNVLGVLADPLLHGVDGPLHLGRFSMPRTIEEATS